MELKKEIQLKLKSNRPNLSVGSVKTYTSLLFNLQKRLNDKPNTMGWYEDSEDIIIESLENVKDVTKKTILSAYFVLEKKDKTQKLMVASAKTVNDNYTKQTKSTKQEENWISSKEVVDTYEKYKKAKDLIVKKKVITDIELMVLRDYMLLCFYVLNAPRRSLDLAEMKINKINKKGNYIDKNYYVINVYKTSRFRGEDRVLIDPEALKFIKVFKKYNPTDYLVFNNKREQMTSSPITRALNGIFGKNVSVNMLRHVYLSSKYADMPSITELESTANKLGHSVSTMLEYIKK